MSHKKINKKIRILFHLVLLFVLIVEQPMYLLRQVYFSDNLFHYLHHLYRKNQATLLSCEETNPSFFSYKYKRINQFFWNILFENYLNTRINKTFRTCKLCFIFNFNKNQKIQIIPHIMFNLCMIIKWNCFIIKFWTIKSLNLIMIEILNFKAISTANKTCISQSIIFFLFFLS